MFFNITRDLKECLLINPSLSPYEVKSKANTPSFLYTPTSLNHSFFGSPNSSMMSDMSPNRPGVVSSMLHMGRGRGILGNAQKIVLIRIERLFRADFVFLILKSLRRIQDVYDAW